jgi:hypothetical protein
MVRAINPDHTVHIINCGKYRNQKSLILALICLYHVIKYDCTKPRRIDLDNYSIKILVTPNLLKSFKEKLSENTIKNMVHDPDDHYFRLSARDFAEDMRKNHDDTVKKIYNLALYRR